MTRFKVAKLSDNALYQALSALVLYFIHRGFVIYDMLTCSVLLAHKSEEERDFRIRTLGKEL